MQLLIRRDGALIDVSPDGTSPLPPELIELLRPHLYYEYRVPVHGHNRYDPDGRRAPSGMDITPRYMYAIEEGRLTTTFGLMQRVVRVLREAGHDIWFVDLSPPRRRPRCYQGDMDNCRRYVTFRPGQAECFEAIIRSECGIIKAPPGFGKTEMLIAICHYYPYAKIHITVPHVDIVASIVRRLSATIPDVGHVGGGRKHYGDRVTVFSADSLHLSDGEADFLLGDEGHLLIAPRSADNIGRIYRYTRNYTFTATPDGRLDGADERLRMFFGEIIYDMPYPEAVRLGLVCPILVRWLPMNFETDPVGDRTGVPKLRWGLWRNQQRNGAFAADARQYPADHQILMLCATVEHAINLWQHLPEFSVCHGVMKVDELEDLKRAYRLPANFTHVTASVRDGMRGAFERGELKKVIATDVWMTGVDFASLPTMYRLDARESSIISTQGPGRVSRIFRGKEFGEVVDSCDYFNKSFYRKAGVRRRTYASNGWEQQWPRFGRLGGLA